MLGPGHQLAGLDAGKLGKGPIWCLIAPDALAGRKHWVAAITFFVIAIVLVAMDNDFIAGLPALNVLADGPHDPCRIRADNGVILVIAIQYADWFTKPSPNAIVIDPSGHHQQEHFVIINFRCGQDFQLHGL